MPPESPVNTKHGYNRLGGFQRFQYRWTVAKFGGGFPSGAEVETNAQGPQGTPVRFEPPAPVLCLGRLIRIAALGGTWHMPWSSRRLVWNLLVEDIEIIMELQRQCWERNVVYIESLELQQPTSWPRNSYSNNRVSSYSAHARLCCPCNCHVVKVATHYHNLLLLLVRYMASIRSSERDIVNARRWSWHRGSAANTERPEARGSAPGSPGVCLHPAPPGNSPPNFAAVYRYWNR